MFDSESRIAEGVVVSGATVVADLVCLFFCSSQHFLCLGSCQYYWHWACAALIANLRWDACRLFRDDRIDQMHSTVYLFQGSKIYLVDETDSRTCLGAVAGLLDLIFLFDLASDLE